MASNVAVYDASDYAELHVDGDRYYYGYEFGRDGDSEVWGFRVTSNGVSLFALTYEAMAQQMNCPGQWDCQSCLLFGIGLYLVQQH